MAENLNKETKKTEKDKTKQHQKPPALEWIIAVAGLILVAGAIGFMIYEAAMQEKQPPNFIFEIASPIKTSNGFLVKFQLENTGDETAAAIEVEGELTSGEESVEKNSATLTYAPSHSKREGGLLFTKNPNEFELTIRVAGYEKP